MEELRKFDKHSNKILLDKKYAFAFRHWDGFSHRLLSAHYAIDWNYKFIFEMESFECEDREYREEGDLPKEVLGYFETLMELDYTSLKHIYDYENLSIDDIGIQEFLLNFESETIRISITSGLPEVVFTTKTEKLLYDFNEYLKNLIETKYKIWRVS